MENLVYYAHAEQIKRQIIDMRRVKRKRGLGCGLAGVGGRRAFSLDMFVILEISFLSDSEPFPKYFRNSARGGAGQPRACSRAMARTAGGCRVRVCAGVRAPLHAFGRARACRGQGAGHHDARPPEARRG